MQPLNIPYYEQKIRLNGGKQQIFDAVRRRYVALTPEEWVRQNMVSHLVSALHVPATRISNETPITFNGLSKRCDTVVYDAHLQPLMIVEYKAPTIEITQKNIRSNRGLQPAVAGAVSVGQQWLATYFLSGRLGKQTLCVPPRNSRLCVIASLIFCRFCRFYRCFYKNCCRCA